MGGGGGPGDAAAYFDAWLGSGSGARIQGVNDPTAANSLASQTRNTNGTTASGFGFIGPCHRIQRSTGADNCEPCTRKRYTGGAIYLLI